MDMRTFVLGPICPKTSDIFSHILGTQKIFHAMRLSLIMFYCSSQKISGLVWQVFSFVRNRDHHCNRKAEGSYIKDDLKSVSQWLDWVKKKQKEGQWGRCNDDLKKCKIQIIVRHSHQFMPNWNSSIFPERSSCSFDNLSVLLLGFSMYSWFSLIAQKLDDKLQEYITEHCIGRNDSNVCTTVQEVIGGVGSGQFLAAKKSYLSAMIALHPSPSVGLHASLYHA